LNADDDVYLIPFPGQKTLGEQLIEAFQVTALRASGSDFEWPKPLGQIAAWSKVLPGEGLQLIPPALVEIR